MSRRRNRDDFDAWLRRSRYASEYANQHGVAIKLTIESRKGIVSRMISYDELRFARAGWRFVIRYNLKQMRRRLRARL